VADGASLNRDLGCVWGSLLGSDQAEGLDRGVGGEFADEEKDSSPEPDRDRMSTCRLTGYCSEQ
jgi:hypothetical protein